MKKIIKIIFIIISINIVQLKGAHKVDVFTADTHPMDSISSKNLQSPSLGARIANSRPIQAIKNSFKTLQAINNGEKTDFTHPDKPMIKTNSSAKTVINAIRAPLHAISTYFSAKIKPTVLTPSQKKQTHISNLQKNLEQKTKATDEALKNFLKLNAPITMEHTPSTDTSIPQETLQNLRNQLRIDLANVTRLQANLDASKAELEVEKAHKSFFVDEKNRLEEEVKDAEKSLLNAQTKAKNSTEILQRYQTRYPTIEG